MGVNDSEMSMRWNNEPWSIPKMSVLRQAEWIQTKEKKNSERDVERLAEVKQQLQ